MHDDGGKGGSRGNWLWNIVSTVSVTPTGNCVLTVLCPELQNSIGNVESTKMKQTAGAILSINCANDTFAVTAHSDKAQVDRYGALV